MWTVLTIVTIIATAVMFLAMQRGQFDVRRELKVEAPLETTFAAIVDFKSWPEWSPWLLHEPDAQIAYSDDYQQEEGYYKWEGSVIGAGRLTHIRINNNRSIQQQIEFLRPFKSSSEVSWSFEAQGDQTLVSWEMHGTMPFLFRFMARSIEPMIGRDYELGLALLNGYLNGSAAHPCIYFVGRESLDDFSYWSIPFHGNLRQLEASRRSSIESLESASAGKAGLPLTLYHQLDPMSTSYQAEFALPIAETAPLTNYSRREFSGGEYFKITLRGDHRFLSLAWHTLFSHCRMHRIKLDKSRPALEIYQDDPSGVDDSNQINTTLYLAIR